MRFLLDENLHEVAAAALNALAAIDGEDEFRHIVPLVGEGTEDEDIPPLCHDQAFDAVVTLNYKDFGARKVLYQGLLDAGINVIVVRPGRLTMTPNNQVSILTGRYPQFRKLIAYHGMVQSRVLVKVTLTSADIRSLAELIAEIEGGHLP